MQIYKTIIMMYLIVDKKSTEFGLSLSPNNGWIAA